MADYDGTGFRMIGDIHYVGTAQVSSHLITSADGHILIDACCPGDGEGILRRIAGLGFRPRDVRYLAVTHAHIDHLGSARLLAERTGATVCIGEADVQAAEKPDPARMGLAGFEPLRVDRPLSEGDVLTVGDKEVRVYHTPGHTPGCSSFGFAVREGGREYGGFLFGGPGLNVFDPEKLAKGIYGGTTEQFRATLDRLRTLAVDVWLGAHPGQNRTFEKHQLLEQGADPNPYVDPDGFKAFLARIAEGLARLG